MTLALHCATCAVPITSGYVCRTDADRGLAVHAELPLWAVELAATASGIRGQRNVERTATRVDPAGVVDEARLELSRWLDEAAAAWSVAASDDGCDSLADAGRYFVAGWHRAGAFVAAMVAAEQRALGCLDPDEAVLRAQRARVAQHAAGARMSGGVGVPGARPPVDRLAAAFEQHAERRTA